MPTNQQITLQVSGMDCANCAVGITRHLQKKGLQHVHTDFASGEVQFDLDSSPLELPQVITEITKLGYKVLEPETAAPAGPHVYSLAAVA
jgi:P-type Cu+ transporter